MNYLILQAKSDVNLVQNETTLNYSYAASKHEKIIAYFSILSMAIFPIIIGSFRSINYLQKKLKSNEKPETMSTKDAAMFPVIASLALFSFYIIFKIFSKEYINLLLTIYFFILGIFSLSHVILPVLTKIFPSYLIQSYSIQFIKNENEEKIYWINYDFTSVNVISLIFSAIFCLWYSFKKHWIANNVLGIAFAINGIEFLHLNSILNGITLLWGLFFYDIFWVFGTDVMITVAKSFEAPIKLIFPQDILRNGLSANNFAMLGLGDIVIPGIFISLLLRFDISQKKNSYTYFYTCFFSYIFGLTTTVIFLVIFNHAQPALLYLVPCCVFIPLFISLIKGDLKEMFAYKDHPLNETIDEKKVETKNEKQN